MTLVRGGTRIHLIIVYRWGASVLQPALFKKIKYKKYLFKWKILCTFVYYGINKKTYNGYG